MGANATPAARFASVLQGASAERFVAFVTDLWRARGWTVVRDGDRLTVSRERPTPEERTLRIRPGGSGGPVRPGSAVDAVVVPTRSAPRLDPADNGRAVTVFTADDLLEMVKFDLDRAAGESLLRRHFDRGRDLLEPTDDAVPPASGGPTRPRPVTRRRWRVPPVPRLEALALAVAVVAVLGAIAAAGGAGTVPDPAAVAGVFDDPSPADPPTDTGAGSPPTAASTPSTTPTPVAAMAPPDYRYQPRYIGIEPTCERPPGLVIVVILGAVANNDPGTNDGIRTAWAFSERPPETADAYGAFEDFLRDPERRLLFTHRVAEYRPLVVHDPDVVSQRVRLANGTHQQTFRFVLSQKQTGEKAGCWLLAGILTDD